MGFKKIVNGKAFSKSERSTVDVLEAALETKSLLSQPTSPISADYSIVDADAGKLFVVDSDEEVVITIVGTAPMSVGDQIDFVQAGTGQISFGIGYSTVTLNSKGGKLKTSEQWSIASIKKIGTNSYLLVGDLKA